MSGNQIIIEANNVVWGNEPPDLLVLILDAEPPIGRDQFVQLLVSELPKEQLPKNFSIIIRHAYPSVRDEKLVQSSVIQAARHHNFLPDLDRLLFQDLPLRDDGAGVMVAVYRKQID